MLTEYQIKSGAVICSFYCLGPINISAGIPIEIEIEIEVELEA